VVGRRGGLRIICGLGRSSAGWVGRAVARGCRVEEHQRGGFDADTHSAAAEDFRGEQPVLTEGDQASLRDGAIDFQDGAGLGWGQRRRAGRAAPGGSQGGQVGGGQM
jgi:hypothetical protein